ncbi:hypothetical protein C4571_01000, partial [Candidatus Parcubacteria bacterium]
MPQERKRNSWVIKKAFSYALGLVPAIAAAVFLSHLAIAATGVPTIMSYQGRLTDSSGSLLGGSGTTYFFRFSIWNDPAVASGTRLWPTSSPGDTTSTVTSGVFNVNIGDTTNGYPDALTYDFFTSSDAYLQVEVSSSGSSSTFETIAPRQRVGASGFALNAATLIGGAINSSTIGAISPSTAVFTNATTTGTFTSQGAVRLATTTLSALTGSTQCLRVDTNGLISGTGADCAGVGASGWTRNSPFVYLSTSTDLVGIGATSSLAKFFVQTTSVGTTTAMFQGIAGQTANVFEVASSSGSTVFSISPEGFMRFNPTVDSSTAYQWTGSTGNVFLNISSLTERVGLGTTNPTAKLDVAGASAGPGVITARFTSTGGQTADIFQVASSSGAIVFQVSNLGVASSTEFRSPSSTIAGTLTVSGAAGQSSALLTVSSSSGSSFFHIGSDGNVGIGTSSPATQLHIYATSSAPELTIENGSTTGKQYRIRVGAVKTSGTLDIFNNASSATRFAIDDEGRIGVGAIPSSSARFYIKGSDASGHLLIERATGQQLVVVDVDGLTTFRPAFNSTKAYQFLASNSNPVLNINTTNQRVGVGTDAPFSRFSVSGLPPQSNTSTLVLLGSNLIQGGNASGTFIGINPTSTFNGDFLNFQVNSSTKFSVSGAGLASSTEFRSPSSTIGSLTFTNATGTGTLQVNGTAGQTGAILSVASSSGVSILHVGADGKIGIGTSTPNRGLHLYSTGSGEATIKVEELSPRFDWLESDQAVDNRLWRMIASGGDWSLAMLNDATTQSVPAIKVFRSGTSSTGIEFKTASSTLSSPLSATLTLNDESDSGTLGQVSFSGNGTVRAAINARNDTATGDTLRFFTGGLQNSDIRIVVDGAGNVAIATTTPQARLDIWSTEAATTTVSIRSAVGQSVNLLTIASSSGTTIFQVASSGALTVQPLTAASPALAVNDPSGTGVLEVDTTISTDNLFEIQSSSSVAMFSVSTSGIITSQPLTWNDSSTVFTGFNQSITSTGASTTSKHFDFKVNSVSRLWLENSSGGANLFSAPPSGTSTMYFSEWTGQGIIMKYTGSNQLTIQPGSTQTNAQAFRIGLIGADSGGAGIFGTLGGANSGSQLVWVNTSTDSGGKICLGRWSTATNCGASQADIVLYDEETGASTAVAIRAGATQGTTNLLELQNNSQTRMTFFNASGSLAIGTSTFYSATTTLVVCAKSNCTVPTAATSTDTVAFFASTGGATTDPSIIARGTITGGQADIGEFVEVVGNPVSYEAGDLLSVSASESRKFEKSSSAYDPRLAGVVTVTAGLIAGGGEDNHGPIVMALAGRVPVKITGENGSIAVGDPVTASSRPGYGMRATGVGRVVGIALEPFSGMEGKIMVFVNPHWYTPTAYLLQGGGAVGQVIQNV